MVDDYNSNNRTAALISGGVWLQVLVISVAFVVGIVLRPEMAWLFGIAMLVSLFLVWQSSVSGRPLRLTEKYASTEPANPENLRAAIAEAMQHPIFIIDQRAVVRFANKAANRAFENVRAGDPIYLRFRQPDIKRTIEQVLASGYPQNLEYNEPIPDDRWFLMEIAPIPAAEHEKSSERRLYLLGFHEQTEMKRIDRMRSDFIANASHELRTPLASLLGYIETLKGPARMDFKAQGKFIDTMLEQAERMSRLVNDLLSLSRIEMKSHVRPDTTVNISEIIKIVVNSLERVAAQMGVAIVSGKVPDYFVRGDHDELTQVFENLIENACKYGEKGERVEVIVESADVPPNSPKSVTVTVKDYGPGIANEHINRITERFYRVDVARSREKQGTGLGLAIVKHILQRHGTRLKIQSVVGEGSEFSVTLPLAKSLNK